MLQQHLAEGRPKLAHRQVPCVADKTRNGVAGTIITPTVLNHIFNF